MEMISFAVCWSGDVSRQIRNTFYQPLVSMFSMGHSINLMITSPGNSVGKRVGKLVPVHATGREAQDLCRGGELFDRIAQGDLGGEAQVRANAVEQDERGRSLDKRE